MAQEMTAFQYAAGSAPQEYKCDVCGRVGCKLWREYNTFARNTKLLCADHAMVDQNKGGTVDAEGYRTSDMGKTDQIGWLIPAVPTEDGRTFWGYSTVPPDGVTWWRSLPT